MLRVEHFGDESCVITLDTRRMPVVIITWRGEPSLDTTHEYFDRIVGFCREVGRQKFVTIVDARAAGMPNELVSKRFGDKIAETREVAERVMLGSVVILNSAPMHDVLASMQWSLRGDTRVVTVEDFPAAFELANGLLRRAEIKPCDDLSVPLYQLPTQRSA